MQATNYANHVTWNKLTKICSSVSETEIQTFMSGDCLPLINISLQDIMILVTTQPSPARHIAHRWPCSPGDRGHNMDNGRARAGHWHTTIWKYVLGCVLWVRIPLTGFRITILNYFLLDTFSSCLLKMNCFDLCGHLVWCETICWIWWSASDMWVVSAHWPTWHWTLSTRHTIQFIPFIPRCRGGHVIGGCGILLKR